MFEKWIFRWAKVFLYRRRNVPVEIDGICICALSNEAMQWFYNNYDYHSKGVPDEYKEIIWNRIQHPNDGTINGIEQKRQGCFQTIEAIFDDPNRRFRN